MYVQKLFEETRPEVLHDLIASYPLGTLVLLSSGQLEANLLPMELLRGDGGNGVLRGHLSRSNPLWQQVKDSADALVVFQGPNAYISPRWYVNGVKSGGNAPGWNYVTVHAYGSLRMVHEPAWLQAHLQSLVEKQESGRADPWSLAEAAPDFTARMLPGIVGLEITISRLVGKWFLSQQRTPADRASVAAALAREPQGHGTAIAQLLLAQTVL